MRTTSYKKKTCRCKKNSSYVHERMNILQKKQNKTKKQAGSLKVAMTHHHYSLSLYTHDFYKNIDKTVSYKVI